MSRPAVGKKYWNHCAQSSAGTHGRNGRVVEACVIEQFSEEFGQIKSAIEQMPAEIFQQEGIVDPSSYQGIPFLHENIEYIRVCQTATEHNNRRQVFVFQLNFDEAIDDIDTVGEEQVQTSQQWLLPVRSLDGLWDSLIYDDNVKERLLSYVGTSLKLSRTGVDSNIIAWNRVVLLHGPPGTGKTSLCKALAQKVAIRFAAGFSTVHLVEINAHSLFSRWFSESGKLVMKLFSRIKLLLEDEDSFVCVLIDEVESLAGARTAAMSGSDPSDAIRVVNALLTQIDQLKSYQNILILTTSNITGAIDLAFVDRADIKQYIGPPSVEAIYGIFSSCLFELSRVKIIKDQCNILGYHWMQQMKDVPNDVVHLSLLLYEISQQCQGWSGRKLRKLPFLALAQRITEAPPSTVEFLVTLKSVIDMERQNLLQVNQA